MFAGFPGSPERRTLLIVTDTEETDLQATRRGSSTRWGRCCDERGRLDRPKGRILQRSTLGLTLGVVIRAKPSLTPTTLTIQA